MTRRRNWAYRCSSMKSHSRESTGRGSSNWSVGTDTGTNFFAPGKTDDSLEIYCAGIACLAYGLKQHNLLVRSCVASAGNDFRLGAQEAPPAIISLYPGVKFEAAQP